MVSIKNLFPNWKSATKLIHSEIGGGVMLIFMTILSIVIANSQYGNIATSIWTEKLRIPSFSFSFSLLQLINDGLMVVFFFVVGLEIKREVLTGELSSIKTAILPIMAAAGGILVPAVLYLFLNGGGDGSAGWAIPVATDIAFVVGILALLKDKIPLSLRIFMTALAIVDDIGAIIIIAIFYTATISTVAILAAFVILLMLALANYLKIASLTVYSVLGILLWIAFLYSGVHATIAGVLLAFTIPTSLNAYSLKLRLLLARIFPGISNSSKIDTFNNPKLNHRSPLQIFEHVLQPWVTYLIIPLFALANAGVVLGEDFFVKASHPISIGIIVGLFLGKQLGIFGFTFASIKLKLATKPTGSTYKKIYGISILGGIGFTMSLFVANLSFPADIVYIEAAKVGIIIASVASGITGYLILRSD